MKYIKLSEWCKKHGLSYKTGHRMFTRGEIPNSYQTPTKTILVGVDEPSRKKEEYNVVYARVSSNEQAKTNLVTQAERVEAFVNANGKIVHKVVKDIGSGLNDNRKKLMELLSCDKTTAIYVEHQDRLTRFGFNYIKMICDIKGINLVVINQVNDKENEIMQDFISLVTSFCSRIYGTRRTKRKTEKIIEVLKENNEED